MASIGWIDFSPAHRERVGTVLELLKPEGMLDELGIGSIRDALADRLFPGISTIQTRAKYFFIVPYILYEYQQLKPWERRGRTAAQYLEQREYEIMWQLGDKYRPLEEGRETRQHFGVIGITRKRPQKIIRRPSAIYWNGLRTYGIIPTGGLGVNQFLQKCTSASLEHQLSSMPIGDDTPGDDADADHDNTFRIRVPFEPEWSKDLSMELTEQEADILFHRMLEKGKGHLIGELMQDDALYEAFCGCTSFTEFVKRVIHYHMPEELRQLLILAHDFSELLYGAHIAYNHLLQSLKRPDERHGEAWEEWISQIPYNMLNFDGFDPNTIFHRYAGRTREFTKSFILQWWEFIKQGGRDLELRDHLIIHQEKRNKQGKARLFWKKLDDVPEGHWVGLRTLEYRYGNAKRILSDIQSVLKKEHAAS